MPDPVADIVEAARSVSMQASVARWCWGVGVGQKRRWVLTGDRCCPLAALLVARGAVALDREKSPVCAAARELGITEAEALEFTDGFDDRMPEDAGLDGFGKTVWYERGRLVARELGVA